MEGYECVLLVKPEVFVYKIAPRGNNRGYRAADWNLTSPDWTGRMRVVVKNKKCLLKLEDKLSGELFAQGPIEKYPGIAVEAVSDSSRYFVVRIEDDSGKAAFIGLGFGDRSDSFDLNVALQDYFKYVKQEEESDANAGQANAQPALDLGFKEGQTIKINMKITKKDGQESSSSKPKPKSSKLGILPPPPGGIKIPPPSPQRSAPSATNSEALRSLSPSQPTPKASTEGESWGDFATARATESTNVAASLAAPKETKNSDWVTF